MAFNRFLERQTGFAFYVAGLECGCLIAYHRPAEFSTRIQQVIRSKLAQSDELSHVLDDLEIGHVNVFGDVYKGVKQSENSIG